MSFCKCVKHACIQVHEFQMIIKCDDDIRVRVQNSDASNFKYSTLVVVIVVHYYYFVQNSYSLLRTNQDFHTQMWQEKCDLGFNRGPVLNVSRVSRASCSSDKKTFEISILTTLAHFLFLCSLFSNCELPRGWNPRAPL